MRISWRGVHEGVNIDVNQHDEISCFWFRITLFCVVKSVEPLCERCHVGTSDCGWESI